MDGPLAHEHELNVDCFKVIYVYLLMSFVICNFIEQFRQGQAIKWKA